MKMLILAAGEGTRLRPHTENKPKCEVEVGGKPIIKWILEAAKKADITDISLVTGYKNEALDKYDIQSFHNAEFDSSNMLYSFLKAKDYFDDDLIVSYSDIVYNPEILTSLKSCTDDFTIVADKKWYDLWKLRMENPLDDAESFKVDEENSIIDIGRKETDIKNIEAQYLGLMKFSKSGLNQILEVIKSIEATDEGRAKVRSMYFTDLLRELINRKVSLKPMYIEGGWFEIDTVEDLAVYNYHYKKLLGVE